MAITVQTTRVVDSDTGRTVALLHDSDHGRVTITTADVVPETIAIVEDDVQAIHLAVTRYLSGKTATDIDTILPHYIECALWSSTDDEGEPLDNDHDADDLAPETVESMRADLAGFVQTIESEGIAWRDYMSGEQLAHDLWLTRNHHGAGFWDRGYPGTIGEALTKWAHSFGTVDLYVGDDGMIYAS